MSTPKQYCTLCRRHYPGGRSVCPVDGKPLTGVPDNLMQEGSIVEGRYVLTNRLAVGGMASIFRARRMDNGEPVALKLLLSRFLSSPQVVNQFFQEARIIRRLQHPNVVALHDFGRTEEGYLFMAMELLGGATLAEYLWNGQLPPVDRALRIFFQVVDALAAAHEMGIVHADLKASNVLFVSDFDDDERVKVLDFGIARLHNAKAWQGESPSNDMLSGTPQYMSPEQIAGEHIDPRTDVYASGILLFQLLTGRVPFDGDDPLDVCRMQREERPPRLKDVAPGRRIPFVLEQFVERLLRKDPEGRPATAADVVEETKEMLRQAGPPTRPSIIEEPEPEPEAENDIAPLFDLPAEPEPKSEQEQEPEPKPESEPEPKPESEPEPEPEPEEEDGADLDIRKRFVTLLDMAFDRDDRPFSLLDEETMALIGAPIVEAVGRAIVSAGGVVIERDTFGMRAAFGLVGDEPLDAGKAIDVALAFLRRVEAAETGLGVGFRARCGIATGPLYYCPDDRLDPNVLVKGGFSDIAARLVQRGPWGGVAIDGATRALRAKMLEGATMRRLKARRSPKGVKIYWFRPRSLEAKS